jgi:hypothetical protein
LAVCCCKRRTKQWVFVELLEHGVQMCWLSIVVKRRRVTCLLSKGFRYHMRCAGLQRA